MSSSGLQLSTLQQRVSALEQQIAALQGSEALQPNYLNVTPDGQVGATFTGVIQALGVLLPVYLAAGKAANSFVKWIDPDNGLLGGGLIVEYQAGTPNQMYTVVQANAEQTADLSQVNLQARDDTDTQQASINVTQQNRGATSSVNAFAGTAGARIIDQDGGSTFAKIVDNQAVFANQVILAGGGKSFVVDLSPNPLPTTWQLILMFQDLSNGSLCTWALSAYTSTSITFEVHNSSTANAGLNIYATILDLTT